MADVRITVPAAAVPVPNMQARLICGSLIATLPWWPDSISRDGLADSWVDQTRPGRTPLLLKDTQVLPEISIGFIASNKDIAYIGDGGSVAPLIAALEAMAKSVKPVQLMLAAREAGRFRVTSLSVTELDHSNDGQPIKAEVSITLKQASDASAPIGPVPAVKKKKK